MRLTAKTAAKRNVRSMKIYKLTHGIPSEMRRGSAGRAILLSISKHRGATAHTIRKDMARNFSDATLRFYLGKFQTAGVIVSVAA